jgi:hypothetical protein
MNALIFLVTYFGVCTVAAIITQFTGHADRNFREAILVWWFFPLVFIYFFTSLIYDGPKELLKSMREFKNELMNS